MTQNVYQLWVCIVWLPLVPHRGLAKTAPPGGARIVLRALDEASATFGSGMQDAYRGFLTHRHMVESGELGPERTDDPMGEVPPSGDVGAQAMPAGGSASAADVTPAAVLSSAVPVGPAAAATTGSAASTQSCPRRALEAGQSEVWQQLKSQGFTGSEGDLRNLLGESNKRGRWADAADDSQ